MKNLKKKKKRHFQTFFFSVLSILYYPDKMLIALEMGLNIFFFLAIGGKIKGNEILLVNFF